MQVDRFTQSLLHFDSGLKDETGRAWRSNGSFGIQGGEKRFGGGALRLSGGNIYSSIVPLSWSDSFTIEMWVKFDSLSTQWQYIFSSNRSGLYEGILLRANYGSFGAQIGHSESWHTIGQGGLLSGQYNHVSLNQQNNKLWVSVNGIVSTPFNNVANYASAATVQYVGSYVDGSFSTYGYLDEFRITKGTVRYTKNFKVPKYPFGTPVERIGRSPLLVTPSIQQSLGVR